MFEYFFPNPKNVEEFQINRQLSKIHQITEWDNIGDKGNYKYYNGERFFRVSRRHYPQFKRGYLWGYYEKALPQPKEEEEKEIIREF